MKKSQCRSGKRASGDRYWVRDTCGEMCQHQGQVSHKSDRLMWVGNLNTVEM